MDLCYIVGQHQECKYLLCLKIIVQRKAMVVAFITINTHSGKKNTELFTTGNNNHCNFPLAFSKISNIVF